MNYLKTILLCLALLYQVTGHTQSAVKNSPFSPLQSQQKLLSQIIIDSVTGDDKINLAEVLDQRAYITGRVNAPNVNRIFFPLKLKFGQLERSVYLAMDRTFKYRLTETDYLNLNDGNLTIYASFQDYTNNLTGSRDVEVTAIRPAKARSISALDKLVYSPAFLPLSSAGLMGVDYEPNKEEWHFSGVNGLRISKLSFDAQGFISSIPARNDVLVNLETGWGISNRAWRHGKISTQINYFSNAYNAIQKFHSHGVIKDVLKMPEQISNRFLNSWATNPYFIALSPDGNTLYAALSLSIEGDDSNMKRIIAFDRRTNLPIKQYAYRVSTPNGREGRILSILAVDNDKLLVLENEIPEISSNSGQVQHVENNLHLVKLANARSISENFNLNRNSATVIHFNNSPLFSIKLRSDGSGIFDYTRFPLGREMLNGGAAVSDVNSGLMMTWGPQFADGSESLVLVNDGSAGFSPYAFTFKVRP